MKCYSREGAIIILANNDEAAELCHALTEYHTNHKSKFGKTRINRVKRMVKELDDHAEIY